MATTAGNRSIPWDWYVDPAVARLEQETIFRRTWQYAGHTGEAAEPGTFTPARVGDVPVVLVRDPSGTLRAFVNVCRHRGHVSATRRASGRRSSAPTTRGRTTSTAPSGMRRAPTRSPASTARSSGSCRSPSTRGGPSSSSIPTRMPSRSPTTSATFRASSATAVSTSMRSSSSASGGGVRGELEGLRRELPRVLPLRRRASELLEGDRRRPGTYTLEEHPTFSSQYGPPKNGGGGVYDAGGEIDRGQFHLLFPGTTINVMPGRGNFSIGPVMPLGAERTYRFLDYFFLPDADEQWIADMLELDNQVGAEDRVLVERVQLGMRSGMIDRATCCPSRSG